MSHPTTQHVEAMLREARAEALREAADALVWKRPEKSPCADFVLCCGSEADCQAMSPSAAVVGEDWLRARAEEVRRG